MSDIVIKVENLSKLYHLGEIHNRTNSFREKITKAFTRFTHKRQPLLNANRMSVNSNGLSDASIWALKDVSFEIMRGDVVGIIGRNGAGKSTLLKILSRITKPTSGRAIINGRVGSLLEVGTGFHAELTGRENIFLNGAILGMKKREIKSKFDEILSFAEVEKFIDTPVKRYSSGMYVRLAFAVAAHLEPDILLVDEVLAVGDAKFQKKCLGKMSDIAGEGRTVFLVSHNLGSIARICKRSILLEAGRLVFDGESNATINYYLSQGADTEINVVPKSNTALQIMSVRIITSNGVPKTELRATDPFDIQVEYEVRQQLTDVHIGIWLYSGDGNICLTGFDTDTEPSLRACREPGRYVVTAHVPARLLNPGFYSASIYAYVHWGVHYDRLEGLTIRIMDQTCMSTYTDGGHRMGYFYPVITWQTMKIGESLYKGNGWIGMSHARY